MQPNETHVWWADLDSHAAELAALRNSLDEAELARANTFRFERDRNRFVTGRALLRRLLAGYLETEPAGIAFAYGAQGKPRLTADHALKFNVAHSGALFACAITTGREIGVDVEQMKDIQEMDEIAAHTFPAEEAERVRVAPASEKTRLFYQLWTRHEAVAKCSGLGIAVTASESPFRGTLMGLALAPGYAGAVAVESGAIDLTTLQVVRPRAN